MIGSTRYWTAGLLVATLSCLSPSLHAGWRFGAPLDLTPASPTAFPHLDASGRKAIAASGGRIALSWEDSSSGAPACHVAVIEPARAVVTTYSFGRGECFEPAVAALPEGRFALIWEDEQGVAATLVTAAGLGPVLGLGPRGGQGSLTWHPSLGLHAAWSGPDGRWRRIWHTRLHIAPEGRLAVGDITPADTAAPTDDQLQPVLAATASGLALAWEDRRHGHTVIYGSASRDGRSWSPARRISQNPTGRINEELGRGSGAMRPTLASLGGERLAAVWLDKRDFLSGYDVYAALSDDGGLTWGRDRIAQDSFGDAIAQWHAAAAGNAQGVLAIAWDDERDGTADIWLTWLRPDGRYADNVSPAGGPGSQSDPVIALDDAGDLHLVWIERDEAGMARLRYAVGQPAP